MERAKGWERCGRYNDTFKRNGMLSKYYCEFKDTIWCGKCLHDNIYITVAQNSFEEVFALQKYS